MPYLQHALHVKAKEIFLAQCKKGQSHLEDDLHPFGQERIHDPTRDRQRQCGREESEEPAGGVHAGVKALRLEVDVQVWNQFLVEKMRNSYFSFRTNNTTQHILKGT